MSLFKLSGAPSPPRRLLIQPSATSPFCTSPSQLQEVTLDPDATNFSYMGMRSPGAMSGRSVKEIDEQLTNLRKENFNLKLRIYFLEERMGANFNTDKEDAIKKNIELMVELENVRKELEDKQELLCQAAKAMEIEEEEKKKEVGARDEEISKLKDMLGELVTQLQAERQDSKQIDFCTEAFDLHSEEPSNTEVVKRLQNTIKDLQTELEKERERADQFENIMEMAENARIKCETYERQVQEKNDELYNFKSELDETRSKIEKFDKHIIDLEEKLQEKATELENAISNLTKSDKALKDHQLQFQEVKKLYETTQQQKDRCEKKAERYKSLLTHCENKNVEMVSYADSLKNKIQNLEVRLAAALHEVKRPNSKAESVSSGEQRLKSCNTDVALFSVRKVPPVPETSSTSSKGASQITRPYKFYSPAAPTTPTKSQSSGDKCFEAGEMVLHQNSPGAKNTLHSDNSGDMQLSQEEFLELKRNHYKACKIIKTMIQKKKEYLEQIDQLQSMVSEKGSEIHGLRERIVELSEGGAIMSAGHKRKSIQEKVSELNLTAISNPGANKENSMAADEVHLAEQYKELASELEKKVEILHATLTEKDSQLERFKIEMQAKANQIIDLEFELLALHQGVNRSSSSSAEKEDASEKLLCDVLEKEQKILQLESELRKRTCDLQGIVNKELWEKNRAIEKLQTILKSKDQEISKLEKNTYGKELQLKILKDKINELGVHVNLPPGLIAADSRPHVNALEDMDTVHEQLRVCLVERKHFMQEIEELQTKLKNTPEHDENRQLSQLRSEYSDLQEELEKSEKLRQESQEICAALSTRLEELCQFLDSLLKHKSVLGFLGSDQTLRLQQIVDTSLDLSRTLSATVSLNPDQSLLQLSNITNLLNSTRNDSLNFRDFFAHDEENNAVLSIIPSDVTLTYQSHLSRTVGASNEQAQVIQVLRQQIANLKREIELRDVELEKKLTLDSITEKALETDEQFVDALVDLESPTSSLHVSTPETIYQNLVSDASKLNVSSSMLVAEKSAVSNTTSTTLKNQNVENQSESESWSEPDRTVSLARIGLHDESLKRPSTTGSGRRSRFVADSTMSTESTEEDRTHSLARTPSKRTTLAESRQTIISLHEQVCDLEIKLKEKENQLLSAQVTFYETDNLLKREQTRVEEIKVENSKLTACIVELNKKLEDAEKQKADVELQMKQAQLEYTQLAIQIEDTDKKIEKAEKEKQESEQKISELHHMVGVLEEFRRNAEARMESKDKQMQNTINEMAVERTKAAEAARNAERILESAKKDMLAAKQELKKMHEREEKLREELDGNYKENLKKAEEQYIVKIKTIEHDFEVQANKYREAIVHIQESYEKNYVEKSEVEKHTLETQELTKELESLKCVIQDCQAKMRAMGEKEVELKNKVETLQLEHYDKINDLRVELDNATLQYSEVILEKTKLKNENSVLEEQIQKLHVKESELLKQVNSIHQEFQEVQCNLDAQVSQFEQQKSLLESKLINLENFNAKHSRNAELHDRLIKMDKSDMELMASTSLPNNPSNILDLYTNGTLPIMIHNAYTRQLSDQSGYNSEDIQVDELGSRSLLGFAQMQSLLEPSDVEHERLHANSSPDLGIESDHGRFSSLEANINVPRPLLPSLELAQSMNNLLDPIQDASCTNEQCCKKAKQICTENVDLRKRLLRTRRALEDTLTRLTLANKQKKEVEKSICKQIHKTSQVLRKAKANLDSGSETDVLKK